MSPTWGAIITAAAALVGVVLVFGASLVLYVRRRSMKYDDARRQIELEALRRSLETQIYGLNDRLMATEARWRDANHLLIDSQTYQRQGETASTVTLTPFLENAGLRPTDLKVDPKLVFVLTPFHPEFRRTFEVISDVCRDLGLRALRGDEEYVPGDVLSHVLKLIARARLVIANVDGRNPNVFYELGLAHALNKPTILVGSSPEGVPFDVRSRRIVLADTPDSLKEPLQQEISRSLVDA